MKTMTATFMTFHYPERSFAYVRHVGPYMGDVKLFGKLFNQVAPWMRSKGINNPNAEAISVYHDDPKTVPIDKQRISVGFVIPKNIIGDREIAVMKIPEGKYAVGSFEIDVDEYGEAWDSLFAYIKDNKLKISSGLMYESYKNDPKTHPDHKHLVDICVAVK